MTGSNTFSFKRFTIDHGDCAMKVGTDGVLLGAWCRVESQDEALLDIGTGSGVIALQLAQRTDSSGASIDAIEIDEGACRAAARNFEASDWSGRLHLYNADVKDFARETAHASQYDHIVSNPPYFIDSLTSPNVGRNTARHTVSLGYDDLVNCCVRLLKPSGRISLIVPARAETDRMVAAAAERNLVLSRRTDVHSTPGSGPKRTLLEFLHSETIVTQCHTLSSLTIEGCGPGTFSDEYRALTRDFYLYF
ncbi:MAG: methyltransferase [Alistipes sp.]|jgi:tRNA1Val (adenine37-N6)-methyltransferase|nr:methyltransferase [Alistipes sp.]